MIKLKDTSLDLFRYTLKQGLGIPASQTQEDYQQFLQNIINQLPSPITNQLTPETKQKFLDQKKETTNLTFSSTVANHQIKAQYRHYSLKDNYQLYFTGYINDETIEPDNKEQTILLLNQLKNLIPPPPIELPHLGQTWLLSGCLTANYTNTEITEFVQSVYQNILKTTDAKIPEPLIGQYAGSSILQYWGSNITDNQHLLIILFSNEDDTKYLGEKYINLWLDLFCYRHKIIWAHQNSEKLSNQLVNYYNNIIAMHSFSQLNLQQLKKAMADLSEFVIALNYLEMQASTIRVNAEKYSHKLSEMSAQIPHSNLSFLADFENQINLYQKAIKKDLENFRPCLEVLRSLTDTIRGTVEIRKAESDRQFQTIIGIGGLGVGVASVVASAVAGQVPEIQNENTLNKIIVAMPFPPSWSNLQYILGISLISGVLTSLFAYLMVKLFTLYRQKN